MGRIGIRIAGNLAAGTLGAGALLLAGVFSLTLFGYELLVVTSGSMGKALPIGAVAITRMVDARAIAAGDMVSFRHSTGQAPTTHRVIRVEQEDGVRVLATKGDANASPDPQPVRVRGRIHRVEHVIPAAGYLLRFARTPAGGVALFLVPMIGLLADRRGRLRPRAFRRSRVDRSADGWSVSTFALAALEGAGGPAPPRRGPAPGAQAHAGRRSRTSSRSVGPSRAGRPALCPFHRPAVRSAPVT